MRINLDEVADRFLNRVKQILIEDQKEKGMTASGKSAASLRVVGYDLVGDKSWRFQMKGRAPGKRPPLEVIINWIVSKGIQPDEGSSVERLAWAISTKIAKKGTDIYQGKRRGVNIDARIEQLVKEFSSEFGKAIKLGVVNQINQTAIK